MQSLTQSDGPDIFKSDLSEIFNNLTDIFKDYINALSLSSEQHVILINISGYVVLLMVLTDLTTLLIGDHLINYFKLETKYPKLAKYIKFKNKHSIFIL